MKDPAFLFYPNDYLGGTLGMTFEQKGAYIELLMLQFNRGHMTSHMIGHTLGQNGGQIWDVIKDKFKIDDEGKFYNERLELEQNKRKAYTDSRLNNIKGHNQYTKKEKKQPKKEGHKGGHMTGHMENENINENINIDFELFWNLYDKKVGKKPQLKKKWESLKDDQRAAIMEYIPKYKEAQPDKQYRKNPDTFFNQEGWKDEIIKRTNFKNGTYNDIINGGSRAKRTIAAAAADLARRIGQD